MLRFGKAKTQHLRAFARLQSVGSTWLAAGILHCLSASEYKAVRQLQRQVLSKIDVLANLYAKRIDPEAVGVVVHVYKNPRGYDVEVIGADGWTLTLNTVSEAELLSVREAGKC